MIMSLKQIWFSIIRNITDYGIVATFTKIIKRLVTPFYQNDTYRIYCIDLSLAPTPRPESNSLYVFGLATDQDPTIIEQIEKLAEWLRGDLSLKLSHGYLCVVALDGSKLAGFNLIALEIAHIPVLKLTWELAAGEAWSEQITVAPAYRRQGLGTALRYKAFKELRDRGINRFCGAALTSNLKSLKLAQRAGYTFTEDVQYLKILWHKQWRRREVK